MKQYYYQTKKNWLVLPVILFALASCSDKRGDQQIQKDVQKSLTAQQQGNSQVYSNVSATVKEGVVTLSGQCEGDQCSDSAVARVKGIKGIKNVVNNIKETPSQTDYTLRTSVQSVISKYQGVQADVAAGVVVLRGSIKREQIQPLMNELSILQAKRIDNQLAITQ